LFETIIEIELYPVSCCKGWLCIYFPGELGWLGRSCSKVRGWG